MSKQSVEGMASSPAHPMTERGGKKMKPQSYSRRVAPGATRLGALDVLTALVPPAVPLWASWKQFPAYRGAPSSTQASAAPVPNR